MISLHSVTRQPLISNICTGLHNLQSLWSINDHHVDQPLGDCDRGTVGNGCVWPAVATMWFLFFLLQSSPWCCYLSLQWLSLTNSLSGDHMWPSLALAFKLKSRKQGLSYFAIIIIVYHRHHHNHHPSPSIIITSHHQMDFKDKLAYRALPSKGHSGWFDNPTLLQPSPFHCSTL